MMVTGLGAAVSDALESGAVVSGVGGQYNFVAQAHALPEGRSILCLRATRTAHGRTQSNILWSYGHTTIPRHLRDIVVTEYGVADLRGRTDREVVEALVQVMDARFQDELVRAAQSARKLPRDYRVPDAARANLPQALHERFAPWRARGLFAELPHGGDFTPEEIVLAKALRALATQASGPLGRVRALAAALTSGSPDGSLQPYLARMGLERPGSFGGRMQQRLVVAALREILSPQALGARR
jgi:hypothetical protein